jgi:hypothetical protein
MIPVIALIALVSVIACYLIARSRSADVRFWVLMGLILGPLALPFVCFSKPSSDLQRRSLWP